MDKQEYIEVVNKYIDEPAKAKMIEQIDNFFDLQTKNLNNDKYVSGDYVVLKKDTFMHGFGNSKILLTKYAKEGLISKDFELGKTNKKISYCVSLWHIHKTIKLADYVKNYSGMTICLDNDKEKFKIVPYGEFDKAIDNLRKQNYFSLKAETTMESRFLPSLQKDGTLPKRDDPDRLDGCRQLAFILNGRDKEVHRLTKNNLLDDSLAVDVVETLYNFSKHPEYLEIFKKNRKVGEDERIAYMLFGLPVNMIEGVFVGRIYEHDKKMLKYIKEVLPNCYICNLDGQVIVGNK